MKISDAGPYNQRIDPHILTDARESLRRAGRLTFIERGTKWYHLIETPKTLILPRIDDLYNVQQLYTRQGFSNRLGQALEIAVYKTLCESGSTFLGRYPTLAAHGDDKIYQKDEPPGYLGANAIPDDRLLDFILFYGSERAGIECKNIREWIYPDRTEVKALIDKCLYLDCIPVLIARRVHFSTSAVLNKCGLITHQMLRQYIPSNEIVLAQKASDKNLLGYHDLRLGNDPDEGLKRFLNKNLPPLLISMRPKWEKYKDLLTKWVRNEITYSEFSGLARQRDEAK